jgi:hypothetical protein
MKQTTLYTTIRGKRAYLVKYATSPAYEVKLFTSSFETEDEAFQEFKKTMQGKLECIAEIGFDRKVDFLQACYRHELARLADWNSGKKVQA